jgi:hypothetical protein
VKLCLVTADLELAREGDDAGIERVLVDLERTGKAERQSGRGLFLSTHQLDDVARVRSAVPRMTLVVRINPVHSETAVEVERVLDAGADQVILPMSAVAGEVALITALLAGRAKLSLLVETVEGVSRIDVLAGIDGVDEIHVGLNDLSLSLGMSPLFEPLCGGYLELVARAARRAERRFGFGGVTTPRLRTLPVSPELVIAEHVRLGSTVAWLGRSFRGPYESRRTGVPSMRSAVQAIRACEQLWLGSSTDELGAAHLELMRQVAIWRSAHMPTAS